MRVGLVINKIDTNGGIQKNYRLLFDLFKSKGDDVYLFVMYPPELIEVNDSRIIFLAGESVHEKGLTLQRTKNQLAPFDLFIVNAAQLKAYLNGEHYYLTVHNTWSRKLKDRSFFKRRQKLNELKLGLEHEKVIGISQGVVEDLTDKLKFQMRSAKTIYAPHDFELVKQLAAEKIEVLGDFILGLGGLQKRKRFDLLIKAFAKVKPNFPHLSLVIIGNGPELGKLTKLAKKLKVQNQVQLLGFKENPYPYIRRAKLLVSCSTEEGLPRVLVEALTLKTPIVSTNSTTSLTEIMTGELTNFISPVNNLTLLTQNIAAALINYPEIDYSTIEKFNKHNVYQEYIGLINERAE